MTTSLLGPIQLILQCVYCGTLIIDIYQISTDEDIFSVDCLWGEKLICPDCSFPPVSHMVMSKVFADY